MGKMIGIFTPVDLESSIRVKQIVTLHYFKYTKDFRFSGEKHDFWEIAYVDRGEVGGLAGNNGFDLHQGEAVFHKPGEYHNIWAKGQYANVVIISFVSHSPAMAFFDKKILRFEDEQKTILGSILKERELCFKDPLGDVYQTKMNLVDNPPFGSLQTIGSFIELLLISLVRAFTDSSDGRRLSVKANYYRDSSLVEATKKLLDDNLYNSLTLADVLQKTGFSKTYLTNLFRKHTGQSIMGYYCQQKIAEAQRLISERNLTFTQIAINLGFNTVHHFSGSFKKHTGMTPSEYKRSVQSLGVL